jgi:hypothetical protein
VSVVDCDSSISCILTDLWKPTHTLYHDICANNVGHKPTATICRSTYPQIWIPWKKIGPEVTGSVAYDELVRCASARFGLNARSSASLSPYDHGVLSVKSINQLPEQASREKTYTYPET